MSENVLINQAKSFCSRSEPVNLGCMAVSGLGQFIALTPTSAPTTVATHAFACVEEFENLRAPLSEVDRERRVNAGLTEHQIGYLDRYGYPFVADEFRFHMTLTGALEKDEYNKAFSALSELFRPLEAIELTIESITLAKQAAPHEGFTVLACLPLRGAGVC